MEIGNPNRYDTTSKRKDCYDENCGFQLELAKSGWFRRVVSACFHRLSNEWPLRDHVRVHTSIGASAGEYKRLLTQ